MRLTAVWAMCVVFCAGCIDDEDRRPDNLTNVGAVTPATSGTTGANRRPNGVGGTANRRPTISGSPTTSTMVGAAYDFAPQAADADGDPLRFSIRNQPSWAEFDASTGRLSGVPQPGDEGNYPQIRISVTDGVHTAALGGFFVSVNATIAGPPAPVPQPPDDMPGPGTSPAPDNSGPTGSQPDAGGPSGSQPDSAGPSGSQPDSSQPDPGPELVSLTVRWVPPSENEDGSPLTDLAAYKFYVGNRPGDYFDEIRVNNPGITSYVIDLLPDTYFVAVSALNSQGLESPVSEEASIVIPPQ